MSARDGVPTWRSRRGPDLTRVRRRADRGNATVTTFLVARSEASTRGKALPELLPAPRRPRPYPTDRRVQRPTDRRVQPPPSRPRHTATVSRGTHRRNNQPPLGLVALAVCLNVRSIPQVRVHDPPLG